MRYIVVLQGAEFNGRQVINRGGSQGDSHCDGNKDGWQDDLGEERAPVAGDVVESLDNDSLEVAKQQEVWLQHVTAASLQQDAWTVC